MHKNLCKLPNICATELNLNNESTKGKEQRAVIGQLVGLFFIVGPLYLCVRDRVAEK